MCVYMCVCVCVCVCVYIYGYFKWMYGENNYAISYILIEGRIYKEHIAISVASLVVQMVKNLSAMQGTWVQPLGWEDPREKRMATPSSILAWRIPQTEEAGGLQSRGSQRAGQN